MEFSGQYLTYLEYTALGGTLAEMPFNLLEFQSRKQIDIRTQQRLVNETTIPNEVKLCDFYLIGKIDTYLKSIDQAENSDIVSESIDGYSVSYNDVTKIQEILNSISLDLEFNISCIFVT